MHRITHTLTAAALALGIAVAVPAMASASPVTSADAEPGQRLERACARIPDIETRVDAAVTLIQSDSSTRGSLAWLQVKLQDATTKGHDTLATVIQNRIDVRTARLTLLQQRQTALQQIDSICAAHGFGG